MKMFNQRDKNLKKTAHTKNDFSLHLKTQQQPEFMPVWHSYILSLQRHPEFKKPNAPGCPLGFLNSGCRRCDHIQLCR